MYEVDYPWVARAIRGWHGSATGTEHYRIANALVIDILSGFSSFSRFEVRDPSRLQPPVAGITKPVFSSGRSLQWTAWTAALSEGSWLWLCDSVTSHAPRHLENRRYASYWHCSGLLGANGGSRPSIDGLLASTVCLDMAGHLWIHGWPAYHFSTSTDGPDHP